MAEKSRDLLNAPPEKVVLMYQAVVGMINEGADINTIKVVDITTRAGIGKGTAYEYFSTKEEIITKALLFEMIVQMENLHEIADHEVSFERKIKSILEYGTKHYQDGRTFFQVLKIISGAFDITDAMKNEFFQIKEENICRQYLEFEDKIMQAGVDEGIIKETNIVRKRMVFNSQMISFAIYLSSSLCSFGNNMTIEEAKQFIYDGIVKQLA